MVVNEFIQCKSCNTLINLRAQAGYMSIPFSIDCPTCSSNIIGTMGEMENNFVLIKIRNAKRIHTNPENLADTYYSFELSAEFLTRKVLQKSWTSDYELSPFLRNFNGQAFINQSISKAFVFLNFISEHKWDDLKRLINLNLNGNGSQKYTLVSLNEKLQESNSNLKKVKTPLEVSVALHHMLLVDSGLEFIFGQKQLKDYTNYAKKIYTQKDVLIDYIKENHSDIDSKIKEFHQEFMNLINEFAKIYNQLLPVVSIRINNSIGETDLEGLGITTLNYEQINQFYSHSYEFILRNMNIIFILNNIFVRGDALKYPNDKSLDQFNKISDYNKLSKIDSSEPFSKPVDSLKNKIRHSIAHYDVSVERNLQMITYKDRNNTEKLWYVELANLCLENLSLAFYLNELYYTIEKYKFIVDGVPFNPTLK